MYVLHGLDDPRANPFVNQATLFIDVKWPGSDDYRQMHSQPYMKEENSRKMEPGKLEKLFLATIDFRYIKLPPSEVSVRIRLFKNHDGWKSGWYFEGMLIEPVHNEDKLPLVSGDSIAQ